MSKVGIFCFLFFVTALGVNQNDELVGRGNEQWFQNGVGVEEKCI